ncbi:MAG TPA: methyl-accepting chemotaxis protein [Oscillatoriales cyanobacterium M59_W2019_021]|nr:MAG: methyl-accepting chemotaxis protein [Cyanobacteria bacterium J055]HIK31706.1 methyl-accepting chemotaxis protein [Oscillatoriales cyanobacterium M4454_W2019_049]HIK49625.1 methyl-accepting chemotaxis protein [Oscillatoriales cyanobacterium M59_W2019_021]
MVNKFRNSQSPSNSGPLTNGTDKSTAPADDDLLKQQLVQAHSWERAGDFARARALYEEIEASDRDGVYGSSARKALAALELSVRDNSGLLSHRSIAARSGGSDEGSASRGMWSGLPQNLKRQWQNLSFTNKLRFLLVSGAIVPVAIVTQGLIWQTQELVEQQFREQLQSTTSSWEDDYVGWTQDDSQTEAQILAKLVEVNGINLSDPQQVARQRKDLQAWVTQVLTVGDRRADVTKSFRILTDANGRTLAQGIKIHRSAIDDPVYPPMPQPDRPIDSSEFETVSSVATGIDLGDLAIFRDALQRGEPLKGIELIPGDLVERLGLGKQAYIPPRPGETSTYDTDDYRAGLATVVVHPIRSGDRIVGTAIVGVLHNRHFALLDTFQQLVKVQSISVFAQNWRINTNVPYGDGTRALGTIAPQDISAALLEQTYAETEGETVGQFRVEDLGDENYLTYYRPLYDRQKLLDPANAKPIGMISVGRPLSDLEQLIAQQQRLGLTVGGLVLVVVALAAIPIAKAFAGPLENLARFAQKIAKGQTGARIAATDRADEIGILSRELNQMAIGIESNLQNVKHQEELRRQEAQQQRQEKERLQRGVVNLLLEIEGAQRGDLTVNALVTEGAVGSIADAFNATIYRLRDLVLQVQASADRVNDLAMNSAPAMQQVSQEANIQAAEIQKTRTAIAEIVSSVREVDRSAQQAAEIAQQGAQAANEGEEVMDLTVTSMDNIREAVDETAQKLDRLTQSFQKILSILTLISGISERTNLLAYNASIEASRAGENGQGFRAIAEEVRRLAGRTTEAARSIEQIVEAIQQDTAAVQQAMETGKSEVAEGTDLVGKTKQTLQKLAQIGHTIDRYLQSISQNTAAQTQVSTQANQMVERVASITQTTSSQAEDVARSLQQLVEVAAALQASVSQFRLEK